MLYINDLKQPYFKYDVVVNAVIDSGIDPKKAYIYLAGLGVRGVLVRVVNAGGLDYQQPVKMAVKNNKLVSKLDICKHCNTVIISND